MWYHYVTQTCLTIAVNYWYDQRFDFRYVFYQTIHNIYCNTNKNKNENCDDKDAKLNTTLTCGVLNTNINNNPNKSSSNNIN